MKLNSIKIKLVVAEQYGKVIAAKLEMLNVIKILSYNLIGQRY